MRFEPQQAAQQVVNGESYGTHYANEVSEAWGSSNLWQGKKEGDSRQSNYVTRRQFIELPKKQVRLSGSFGKNPLSLTQVATIFCLMTSAGLGLGIALIMILS